MVSTALPCRAPHGARGLKSLAVDPENGLVESRPAWGAWIEMIKIGAGEGQRLSRPAWGAWIEMTMPADWHEIKKVAPRMGRVD